MVGIDLRPQICGGDPAYLRTIAERPVTGLLANTAKNPGILYQGEPRPRGNSDFNRGGTRREGKSPDGQEITSGELWKPRSQFHQCPSLLKRPKQEVLRLRQLHAYTYSTSGLRLWSWREMRRKAYPAGAAGGFMLSLDMATKIGYLYSFEVRPKWRRRGFVHNMRDTSPFWHFMLTA